MRIRRFFDWLRARLTPRPKPEPLPEPGPDRQVYISTDRVEQILQKTLGGMYPLRPWPWLVDREGYCPSLQYMKRVVAQAAIYEREWVAEVGDCDDFSKLVHAAMVRDAWRKKDGKWVQRAPHVGGRIEGLLPGPHSINWFIDDTHTLYFFEPQAKDDFFRVSDPRVRDIWAIIT